MRGWLFALVTAIGVTLCGCAATTTTSKVAVDYNRIFAKASNEVLVTNILRASAREPLQFSTMGSVTGGVRNTGSLDLNVASLIGKAATIVSPDLVVNEGINPNVSIIPLSSKEFTQGILRPVTLDEISYFINQGWDQELVLQLAVGGVVCPDGTVVLNHGDPSDPHYNAFAAMFAGADHFAVQQTKPSDPKLLRMTATQAIAVMKDGVGAGRTVTDVTPVTQNGHPTGVVEVTIAATPSEELRGLRTAEICGLEKHLTTGSRSVPNQKLVAISADGKIQGKVILRSVESIIYFLGETQRNRWELDHACSAHATMDGWPFYSRVRQVSGEPKLQQLTLFRLEKACNGKAVPTRTFLRTRFDDDDYYLLRQSDAGEGDRSLTTLSLLDELVALQTSESTISSGAPIIAIGSR